MIDEEAEHVYLNGQCLALAVVLAERTGWPIITRTAEDDGLSGFLIHALVRTPDGLLLDIRGVHDPESIELEDEESWREWPAAAARDALAQHSVSLQEQNLAAAGTFVDPVLALHAQDQQAVRLAAQDNEAPPDGCRFCGLPAEGHGTQESERFGPHGWVAPAEHQRQARCG